MKKNSAIEKIFLGESVGFDSVPLTENYSKLMHKLLVRDEEFKKNAKNSPKLITLFDEYDNCYSDLCAEESKNYYIQGFKFGVLLGIDIASNDEKE